MKHFIFLILVMAFFLSGCSGSHHNVVNVDESSSVLGSSVVLGSSSSIAVVPAMSSMFESSSSGLNSPISLYRMGGLAKLSANEPMAALPYDIDLDTITTTAANYFIIENSDTSAITGLSVTSDNIAFKVTPDSIVSLLAPSKSTGIRQMLKVTVEHGTLASGIGFANVLTGDQYATITFKGTNARGAFSVSYVMHVYAKRMVAYVDVPDSMWFANTTMLSSADPRNVGVLNSVRHIHVDAASSGCYINFINYNVSIDSTTTVVIHNERDIVSYDVNYASVFVQPDGERLEKQYKIENWLSSLLDSGSPRDQNCVVLVIDNMNNTQKIIK